MLPSASKAELLLQCPYSCSNHGLPCADAKSEQAALGRAFHSVVEYIVNNGLGTGPAQLVDACLKAEKLDPEQFRNDLLGLDPVGKALAAISPPRSTSRAEVSFRLDPSGDVEELGQSLGRKYPEAPGIFGTADVIYFEADKVVVADWKTGDCHEMHRHIAQLGTLAMMAALAYDMPEARGEIRWARNGKVDTIDYGLMDIIGLKTDLLSAYELSLGPCEPKPGHHCAAHYCPHMSACPAWQDKLNESVPVDYSMGGKRKPISSVDDIESPAHAASLLYEMKVARAIYDVYERSLKEYADKNGPFKATQDGRVWGPVASSRESIRTVDGGKLRAALDGCFGAAKGTTVPNINCSVSKEDIEKAMYANGKTKKDSDLLESLYQQLRRDGIMVTSRFVKYDYHKEESNGKTTKSGG